MKRSLVGRAILSSRGTVTGSLHQKQEEEAIPSEEKVIGPVRRSLALPSSAFWSIEFLHLVHFNRQPFYRGALRSSNLPQLLMRLLFILPTTTKSSIGHPLISFNPKAEK